MEFLDAAHARDVDVEEALPLDRRPPASASAAPAAATADGVEEHGPERRPVHVPVNLGMLDEERPGRYRVEHDVPVHEVVVHTVDLARTRGARRVGHREGEFGKETATTATTRGATIPVVVVVRSLLVDFESSVLLHEAGYDRALPDAARPAHDERTRDRPPPPPPPAAAVPTRPGLDDDFDGWVDTGFDNDEDEDDDDPPASDKFVDDIGRDVA